MVKHGSYGPMGKSANNISIYKYIIYTHVCVYDIHIYIYMQNNCLIYNISIMIINIHRVLPKHWYQSTPTRFSQKKTPTKIVRIFFPLRTRVFLHVQYLYIYIYYIIYVYIRRCLLEVHNIFWRQPSPYESRHYEGQERWSTPERPTPSSMPRDASIGLCALDAFNFHPIGFHTMFLGVYSICKRWHLWGVYRCFGGRT